MNSVLLILAPRVEDPTEEGVEDGRGNTEDFDFWFDFLYFFFVCLFASVQLFQFTYERLC